LHLSTVIKRIYDDDDDDDDECYSKSNYMAHSIVDCTPNTKKNKNIYRIKKYIKTTTSQILQVENQRWDSTSLR